MEEAPAEMDEHSLYYHNAWIIRNVCTPSIHHTVKDMCNKVQIWRWMQTIEGFLEKSIRKISKRLSVRKVRTDLGTSTDPLEVMYAFVQSTNTCFCIHTRR
jgi:hypothetical protein